jgi:hypothetical protein
MKEIGSVIHLRYPESNAITLGEIEIIIRNQNNYIISMSCHILHICVARIIELNCCALLGEMLLLVRLSVR